MRIKKLNKTLKEKFVEWGLCVESELSTISGNPDSTHMCRAMHRPRRELRRPHHSVWAVSVLEAGRKKG